jgi:hypothetical protein
LVTAKPTSNPEFPASFFFHREMTESHLAYVAGEHFVAYKTATMGFLPALVRQSVRGVDLLVTSPETGQSVAVLVKTATRTAASRRTAQGDAFLLRFPLGQRAIATTPDRTIFCFVDLRTDIAQESPDVYIVPAWELKKEYAGSVVRKYCYTQHHRPAAQMARFRNNWAPLLLALSTDTPVEVQPRMEHNFVSHSRVAMH